MIFKVMFSWSHVFLLFSLQKMLICAAMTFSETFVMRWWLNVGDVCDWGGLGRLCEIFDCFELTVVVDVSILFFVWLLNDEYSAEERNFVDGSFPFEILKSFVNPLIFCCECVTDENLFLLSCLGAFLLVDWSFSFCWCLLLFRGFDDVFEACSY